MNESQTRLLIQRELDGNLSQEEENRLRRVLMVNDSAVSFRANLSQIVAAARDLELPDEVRPCDSSQLAVEIIENLPVTKGGFWDPLFDIFANRKSGKADPRSTRSVGSGTKHISASGVSATGRAIPGRNSNQNNFSGGTISSAKNGISKIDPAVLYPDKSEKEKTPCGLPAVDQYITGTHPTLGGLAKKLGKNLNNAQTEDVGKTLADAIREKVHESQNAPHEETVSPHILLYESGSLPEIGDHYNEPVEPAYSESLESTPESIPQAMTEAQPELPPVLDSSAGYQQPTVSAQSQTPASLLPTTTIALNVVPANITTEQLATTVNLGNSLVLTVSAQPPIHVQTEAPAAQANIKPIESSAARGHDFSPEELNWKSGTYPTVPQPAKPRTEAQTETGPLAPFPFNHAPAMAKFNLKDTAEIMNQLAADAGANPWTVAPISEQWPGAWPTANSAWVPPPTPENPAPPADPWAPPLAPEAAQPANPWVPQPVSPPRQPAATPAVHQNPFVAPAAQTGFTSGTYAAPPRPEAVKPQPAKEIVPYEPTIVPVTRNTLPIQAIGERIDRILNEPVDSKPVSQSVPQTRANEAALPPAGPLETSVSECLSSVGRLVDVRYNTNNPGNINNLGRFLLTDETMESIGNCINKGLHHSSARVVTLEAAQQMAHVLEPVVKTRGVIGYLICGYDGLLVTHQLPPDVDVEMLGGCALVTYMNSHSIMKVMGHQGIKQMICQTPGGCMLLADFGKGYLVTLTSESDPGMLATLSDTIAMVSAA